MSKRLWHHACLPINRTEIIWVLTIVLPDKSSLIWFGIAVCYIGRENNWQSPTADHVFTKMFHELNGLSFSLLTQCNIQEVLDEVDLSKIIENLTSEREKARLLSRSRPQSEAWLSAAPIPTPGLSFQKSFVQL